MYFTAYKRLLVFFGESDPKKFGQLVHRFPYRIWKARSFNALHAALATFES